MRRIIQKQPKDRKKLLFIALITGSALVVGFMIRNNVLTYVDGRKFAKIESARSVLANGLSNYLKSNLISSENQDQCFNTGQGPYDNGYLWCQVSTVFELMDDVSPQALGEEFLRAGSTLGSGSQGSGYALPSYFIELDGGIRCGLSLRLSSGDEVSGARRNPFAPTLDNDHPLVAVTCGDRAKAVHYHFVSS